MGNEPASTAPSGIMQGSTFGTPLEHRQKVQYPGQLQCSLLVQHPSPHEGLGFSFGMAPLTRVSHVVYVFRIPPFWTNGASLIQGNVRAIRQLETEK